VVLTNGLSRMRGDPPVRFLGGGGAVRRCCYPTAGYPAPFMASPTPMGFPAAGHLKPRANPVSGLSTDDSDVAYRGILDGKRVTATHPGFGSDAG
jgi:hypothetical protein